MIERVIVTTALDAISVAIATILEDDQLIAVSLLPGSQDARTEVFERLEAAGADVAALAIAAKCFCAARNNPSSSALPRARPNPPNPRRCIPAVAPRLSAGARQRTSDKTAPKIPPTETLGEIVASRLAETATEMTRVPRNPRNSAELAAGTGTSRSGRTGWRRERDSNPRYGFP